MKQVRFKKEQVDTMPVQIRAYEVTISAAAMLVGSGFAMARRRGAPSTRG